MLIRWLLYWAASVVLRAISELPQRVANFLVSHVTLLGYCVFRSDRNLALANLRLAFGEKYSHRERRAIANRIFLEYGRSIAEFAKLPRWGRRRILQAVDGKKYLQLMREGLAKGRGVIVAGAHMGNWELFAAYSAAHFPLSMVAHRLYVPAFDRAVRRVENKLGINIIYQQDGVWPILKVLKQNQVLGVLVDQDIKRVASDFVEFFGRRARKPNAHAALALGTGAPMYLAVLIRKPDMRRFEIVVKGPIEIERTGDKRADRIALVQKWSRLFEELVRQYPDQWEWFHYKWKRRPPGEA